MISVTKAYLPNKEKYKAYVDRIFESSWLTNNGSMLQELEQRLATYLGVKNIILVANGSLALQLAYKALELKGEVITTPFSFAATTSTLIWEGLTPVFADIDSLSLNLDPRNIEPLISDKTSAIVPVHVFGNPCEVEKIQSIADKYNLKVIYDGAHAFGTEYKNSSVLNYGDASTLSFHATKLFHTIEGGAVITNNNELAQKIRMLINFGIVGTDLISPIGTNAKMNEFEAAMGLCVLDEIEQVSSQRKKIWQNYKEALCDKLSMQKWSADSENNNAYAPVIFKTEEELLLVDAELKKNDIVARRYFYPSLDTLLNVRPLKACVNSQDISRRILCLPLFPGLSEAAQKQVYETILKVVS